MQCIRLSSGAVELHGKHQVYYIVYTAYELPCMRLKRIIEVDLGFSVSRLQ